MRVFTILFLFITALVSAQVSLSTSQLDFGDVLTTDEKEMAVNVSNSTTETLRIVDVNLYHPDFTYTIPTSTIEAGATEKMRVTFTPRQNVIHNTELIFILSDGSEHRLDLVGNGKHEGTYYAATFNKSYQDLKDELKTLLAAGYVNFGYSGARDRMYSDIDNVGGNVTCVYTGRVATFNSRNGANSNSFNCEHTWPQSLFSQREPERADIHHLFPTDVDANGRRGSFPFGVVTGSPSWQEGGSKLRGSVFEPRDEQKGATARAMMYFVIRYQDYSNFIDGQEAVLKQWHIDYAPTAWDIQRNDKIFGYQKNRNPFIDHPEFIERINKIGANDPTPVLNEAEISQPKLSLSGITASSERSIFIVNTGNTPINSISDVTAKEGNVIIKSVASSAQPGDVAEIIIGFKNLGQGTYTDEISINLQSQIGKSFTVPVTFSAGVLDVNEVIDVSISVFYNKSTQALQITAIPADAEQIRIWDTKGTQLVLNDITSVFSDIPFANYSTGIYFVEVRTKKGVVTSKFFVQK